VSYLARLCPIIHQSIPIVLEISAVPALYKNKPPRKAMKGFRVMGWEEAAAAAAAEKIGEREILVLSLVTDAPQGMYSSWMASRRSDSPRGGEKRVK